MTLFTILYMACSLAINIALVMIFYKFARKEGAIKKSIKNTVFPEQVRVIKPVYGESLLKEDLATNPQ